MVLLTIQTNESFARDFGKHKFDKTLLVLHSGVKSNFSAY